MSDVPTDASLSAVEQYLRQVHSIPPLVAADEARLLQVIRQENERVKHLTTHLLIPNLPDGKKMVLLRMVHQEKDQIKNAMSPLTEAYQPLVLSIAQRYFRHGCSLELMDLVQEGNLGLLDAITHYDASRSDASLRTWSYSWIRGAILRALWQSERMIRLPARKVHQLRQYEKVHLQLYSELGHEPSLRECAMAMGLSLPDMRDVLELHRQHDRLLSLDTAPDGESEGTTLGETIAAPSPAPDPMKRAFYRAWAQLPSKERIVMTLRLGLNDLEPMTQQQTAEVLGVSIGVVETLDRRARMRLEWMLRESGVLKPEEVLALPA